MTVAVNRWTWKGELITFDRQSRTKASLEILETSFWPRNSRTPKITFKKKRASVRKLTLRQITIIGCYYSFYSLFNWEIQVCLYKIVDIVFLDSRWITQRLAVPKGDTSREVFSAYRVLAAIAVNLYIEWVVSPANPMKFSFYFCWTKMLLSSSLNN